jgi:hypothetical protein
LLHLTANDLTRLNEQLDYIAENDEYGDITAGERLIDESLVEDILDTAETTATAEAETVSWSLPRLCPFKTAYICERTTAP